MNLDNKDSFSFKTLENNEASPELESLVEKSDFRSEKELPTETNSSPSPKKDKWIEKQFSNDSKNVKILLFIGVLAIVLGIWHLVSGIKNSFVIAPIVLEDKSGAIESLNSIKDTDQDGLSDYDEKYVYGTSPYLADTDSDGISDYEEISTGQKPLCSGDTCQGDLDGSDSNSELSGIAPQKIMNLPELKNYLIETGYPVDQVNQLSDSDLNLIYEEVVKAVNNENYTYSGLDIEKGNTDQNGEESPLSAEQLAELQNLSIDQIKELLIQGGATTEQLATVSDEELRTLYLNALNETE
jgi:Bacterial TSP3 repeat